MEGSDYSWLSDAERLSTPEAREDERVKQRLILGAFAAELAVDAEDLGQPTLF